MESSNCDVRLLMGGDVSAIPTSKWRLKWRLFIHATGILLAAGRTQSSEDTIDASPSDLIFDANPAPHIDQNGMELQELNTRPHLVNHEVEDDEVKNSRQSWLRILVLVRFIAMAKIAARPSASPPASDYVQASCYFLIPTDWCIDDI
ncbi:uncharacterized protein LOC107818214 isoform X1 [Nicotiana tabacum]|uniref:Uncharacterized protein LOC107818214 isoform X1 n=1 Tax=Nicotiana tabacum TaxID=4097 RepID=A0A1S4CEK9_TOBAC|nr:PREDICTED: uncharacterized protein LOC107818214 isoform X1 [Nicotiana tabacum]